MTCLAIEVLHLPASSMGSAYWGNKTRVSKSIGTWGQVQGEACKYKGRWSEHSGVGGRDKFGGVEGQAEEKEGSGHVFQVGVNEGVTAEEDGDFERSPLIR